MSLENGHELTQLILEQLKDLNTKVDEVRTKDIPQIKTDVAILVNQTKTSSRIFSGISAMLAVMVSYIVEQFRR